MAILEWRLGLGLLGLGLLGLGCLGCWGAGCNCACSSLAPSTARLPATRGWGACWPVSYPTTNMTKRSFSGPTTPPSTSANSAGRPSGAWPHSMRNASPIPCGRPMKSRTRSPICNSRRATAYPSSSAGFVRRHLNAGSFVVSSSGPTTTDLDGNRRYDLTGSYGVNVFGYDFYKECIERGSARVRDLGPVLGAYHPVTADNVHRLRAISGLDEISFHMSGTEAVMQAVRLARYHTRRRYLVRFCGAYHGWWGEVQPGVGNPVTRARHADAQGYG